MALLDILIWNNTLLQWLYYLGVLFIAFFGTKAVYWIFSKVLRFLVRKTKTQLDDLLIDALEKPILLLVFIWALSFGKDVLTLSTQHHDFYVQGVNVLLMVGVVWFIVRFVDALLANYLLPYAKSKSSRIDDTLYPLVKGTANFIIYVIGIIIIIQQLGFEVTSLLAGLGIGGLALALAAQDVLSNFIGGAAVVSDKPFAVGDRIIVSGNDGFVRKIGMRSTEIETFDGTKIVIPNKVIASEVVENISAERARRVKMQLGLVYSTPVKKLEQAKEILKKIVLDNKSTDDNSSVHFINFNSSSVDIQLIYWIKDLDRILDTKDEINMEIKRQFDKAKLSFAFPSTTVYLEK